MTANPSTLRARHLAALDVVRRFLEIDDWRDDLIAPADLVRDARALVGAAPLAQAHAVAPARGIGTFLVATSAGTVVDELNGIEWQAQDDGKSRNFEDAEAYCKALTLGGHSDWRLPTQAELLSLVDHTRYRPAINANLFPGTRSEFYWSSTPYADDPADYAWGVYFSGGGAYANRRSLLNGFVRAVRSVAPASPGQ